MSGIPVYDIECLNWTEVIAVGLYDGETYHEFLKTSDEDDVLWRFLQFIGKELEGIKLYAHNAAKYDAKFILAKLQEKREGIRLEAGLMRLVWTGPRITFEDSYAAMPSSLKSLSESFGVSNKLSWSHEDTESPWIMEESKLEAFRYYLKRDCIALSEVMEAFCKKLLINFGVSPSLSLSLTAVKAFSKNFYPVDKIQSNEVYDEYLRASTYGARNEVYKMYGENINFYDVRSMYMSCYDTPVPIGKLYWTTPNIDTGTIAHAKVKIPKSFYLGPLPFRYRRGLVFPVGEIEGWWDTTELRFAAKLGCDVSITRQLRAEEEPILKEFAKYVYELRRKSKDAEAKIWKLFGLRVSGKFGQSRWQSQVLHADQITDYTGSFPIDPNEEYHEFLIYRKGHRAPYIKPAINVRVRAEARVRHLKLLLEAWSRGEIYYSDTDSVACDSEMSTGTNLGELKLVNQAVRAYFIQCKFYGYVSNLGVLHQTSAGFRDFKLLESDFLNLIKGDSTAGDSYFSLSNWRKILLEAEVRQVNRKRTVSSQLGFRNRLVLGQTTAPISL